MYTISEPVDPRILWPLLPGLSKVFLLLLCLVIVYTVYALSQILLRLFSLKKLQSSNDSVSTLKALAPLRRSATNIQQLILFTFFLFALIFFLQIPGAFLILGDHRGFPMGSILQGLVNFFGLAVDVLFVLVLLHSAQWLVSARISSVEIRFLSAEPTNPSQS